jgi:uncharacterized protein (TIGR03032 family)
VLTEETGRGPVDFSSSYTSSFPAILKALGASLVVSTYQSGRLIVVREEAGTLNTHFRTFDSPMGLAVSGGRLVVGTARAVWDYHDQPAVARRVEPAGKHDACYIPRSMHVTGNVRIHEVFLSGNEIWFVNTLFSCLAAIDLDSSFVPKWRPPFVSALSPEDRCHLNGVAVVDGSPRCVTALGVSDTPNGWRDNKGTGGVIIDVQTGTVVTEGLCMPHSPRVHDGRLWVLESGNGALATVDPGTGSVTTVVELPGFTRGLAFAGPYAFVGLSQVRESVFAGIPVVERPERLCGVWVVDLRDASVAGFLRFQGSVEEIFDVQVLPHRFPEVAEQDNDLVGTSFVVPTEALGDVPEELRAPGR